MSLEKTEMSLEEIKILAENVLLNNGCNQNNALAIAETVYKAERDGSESHGLFRIPGYIASLKSNKLSDKVSSKISPVEYKKTYIDALSAYQNGDYNKAINGFSGLVLSDPTNDLADNSQYWLAECYYTMKNYKRAVIEFEKVFSFSGTDKDDDAQLKLGHCHRSMGNIQKSKEEYQRLIDYFPGSEFYEKARESLKQLSVK